MRVLYVTDGLPYPLTSGRLRHYFLIRELSQRHVIGLVSLVARDVEPDDVRELQKFADVRLIGERRTIAHRIRRALGFADPALRRLAGEIQESALRGEVDVVLLAARPAFGLFRLLAGRVPIVVDLCDSETLHLRRRMAFVPARERPMLALRYAANRRREQTILRRSDAALFASARDRRAVAGARSNADRRLALVPNGVDLDRWRRQTDRLGDEVVFSGALDYGPNADAATYLIDVILPLVRRDVPEVSLRIVGRDPSPSLRQRALDSGVTLTGFVDDMRPHLERAAVFAAPLRYGAGIQNKLLEAMAMGLPCVASSLAAAGLDTPLGPPPIVVADDPADFTRAIVGRLRAAGHGAAPDSRARAYVAQHFSWSSAGRALEDVFERVSRAATG